MYDLLRVLLPILLFLTSTFLILLVLIQRGRGGGLAGAFGGLGGQSAFGTKAGDLFTRITIGVAAFWIILCAVSVKVLSDSGAGKFNVGPARPAAAPPTTGGGPTGGAPTGGTPAGSPPASSTPAATPGPAIPSPTTGATPAESPAATPAAESPADAAPADAAPATTAPATEAPAEQPK